MSPRFKLTYFDLRGRAEPIRMLFALAGIPLEDKRITFEEWPETKKNAPFGALPMLEFDGIKLSQTLAILRYVARENGFAGPDNLAAARADSLCDQYVDFGLSFKDWYVVNVGYAEGDEAELRKSVYDPAKARHFPYFEEALKQSSTGWYAGTADLTYVDLFIAASLEVLKRVDKQADRLFDEFPLMSAQYDKVFAHPKLQKYLAERPEAKY